MTQNVQLSADTTTVVSWFASPQPANANYAAIADTDARYLAWQTAQAGQQSYVAAVIAGVAVTSTGTPALNGTYALDAVTQSKIASEQIYIATKGTFTNGQTTRNWPDVAGALHLFPSTAEFTDFAEAVAQYVDALETALAVVQGGGAWSAPAAPAALA